MSKKSSWEINLMNLIISSTFLVYYHSSEQSWPWKPFCCVDITAHGALPLWGTLPPWLKWEFSWVLFSTGTMLHLCYLSRLLLSSVLQVGSVEGLLHWICGKCFWMLQYDAVVYLSFGSYLSSQLSRPEEAEKQNAAVNDSVFAFIWQALIVIFWVSCS